jgi:hypothetical protein
MKKCLKCGHINSSLYKKCASCFSDLSENKLEYESVDPKEQKEWECPYCNYENYGTTLFCRSCKKSKEDKYKKFTFKTLALNFLYLFTIFVQPKKTIRKIIDGKHRYIELMMIMLATLNGISLVAFSELYNRMEFEKGIAKYEAIPSEFKSLLGLKNTYDLNYKLIVFIAPLAAIIGFYMFSYILYSTAGFGAKASLENVRIAYIWGNQVPAILGNTILVILLLCGVEQKWVLNLISVLFLVFSLAILCKCLNEVQGYEIKTRALKNVLYSVVIMLVIVIPSLVIITIIWTFSKRLFNLT